MFGHARSKLPTPQEALAGRSAPMPVTEAHFVNGRRLIPPYPEGHERLIVGMGCFWGAEKAFWDLPGVWVTAVGYAGGTTPNPTYEETCTGMTGHTEAVLVVFDPSETTVEDLLRVFWEGHDPTQGMRQGNDMGTQYRSAIYTTTPGQLEEAMASRERFGAALAAGGFGAVTTEIAEAGPYYFAEGHHQQYLARNPNGYCGLGGTGVSCPIGPDSVPSDRG